MHLIEYYVSNCLRHELAEVFSSIIIGYPAQSCRHDKLKYWQRKLLRQVPVYVSKN